MANISLNELKDVISKAGLAMPAFDPKKVQEQNYQTGIANQVTALANPAVEEAKKKYLDQIGKIAQMDGKLSGVYSDPTSNLYIEHAGARQNALSGAQDVGYNAANVLRGGYENAKKGAQDLVDDYLGTYKSLLNTSTGSGEGSDLGELLKIFPWLTNGSLEDILSQKQDERPDLSSFDSPDKPPLESFDSPSLQNNSLPSKLNMGGFNLPINNLFGLNLPNPLIGAQYPFNKF